jgi:hypothetical protein
VSGRFLPFTLLVLLSAVPSGGLASLLHAAVAGHPLPASYA